MRNNALLMELRKGKYAIDSEPFVLYDCLRFSRFQEMPALHFPLLWPSIAYSKVWGRVLPEPQRLNCITYYCLLFGARFAHSFVHLFPSI